MMNSIERVDAVLAGRLPDRPPFSFWYHFPADQVAGAAAVQAHLDLLERYEPDFLKVMNDNPYPHSGRIERVEDLAALRDLRGDEDGFGQQLELIAALRARVGRRVYLTTTIFNAWMVLRLLIQPPKAHMPPNLDAAADAPSRWIREAYAVRPDLVRERLRIIGSNLARFAGQCLRAGADGVFLSVRDDWVDTPEVMAAGGSLYAQIVRPADMAILDAVKEARFNILHVCGTSVNLRAFGDYPVPAMHWADRAAGPAIAQVKDWLKPAICGGVDNLSTLPNGGPEDVAREIADAVRQASPRPMIVAPGCTFDPSRVPQANLTAMVEAVRRSRYAWRA